MKKERLAEVYPVGDVWGARLRVGNRLQRVGWYSTEQEAHQAVEEFRRSYEEEDRCIKQAIAQERQKGGLKEYTASGRPDPLWWVAVPTMVLLGWASASALTSAWAWLRRR